MTARKKHWTKKDLNTFDRLVSMMDSPLQMDRISGRIEWHKFADRFTKEELDEMWQYIKDKK